MHDMQTECKARIVRPYAAYDMHGVNGRSAGLERFESLLLAPNRVFPSDAIRCLMIVTEYLLELTSVILLLTLETL